MAQKQESKNSFDYRIIQMDSSENDIYDSLDEVIKLAQQGFIHLHYTNHSFFVFILATRELTEEEIQEIESAF